MPSPRLEALALAGAYRLALEERPGGGPAGARLGKGTGASLEFQDRRAYVAGDDVRHLDWRAYARTDQLFVRLYREEVSPTLELVLDASRSMDVGADKCALAVDLAGLLGATARAEGTTVRVIVLGDRPEVVPWERLEREGLQADRAAPLAASLVPLGPLLRPGSIRVIVSDFLSPHDPARLVRTLGSRAGGVGLLQVLAREDLEPPAGEALRLEDVETGEVLDLVLDPRTVERYLERLERLRGALAEEARRVGGVFSSVSPGGSLDEICRERLVPDGLLVPA